MSFLRQLSSRQASASTLPASPKAQSSAQPNSPVAASVEEEDKEAEKKDEDLIVYTQTIAAKVHQQAAEVREKLMAIQGGEVILEKMLEVINEVEAHHKRIAATLGNPSVYVALKGLCESIGDCSKFLGMLNRKRFLLTAKARLRREMLFLQQAVRNRCTQLMTAVSLALADRPSLFPLNMTPDELERTYFQAIRAYYGIECPKNVQIAARLCISGAEHGHTSSMLLLSQMYEEGIGLEVDAAKSRQWLELAASKQHAHAQNRMAMKLLREARETNPNVPVCLKAACTSPTTEDMKFHDHMSFDGSVLDVEEKVARAVRLLLSAAELGCVEAQTNLGGLHEEAGDYEEAISLYETAIAGGCARAENCLAMLHQAGKGLPKDEKLAFTMFMSAARKGNGHACYNAALCLEHGIGTHKDLVKALTLYQEGVKHDNAMCTYSLGYLYCKLAATDNPDAKETYTQAQQGILLLQRASQNGIAEASYHLANIYDHGKLTIRSRASALTYYEIAAKQGHGKAALRAGDLWYSSASNGNVEHFARAIEYYEVAVRLERVPEAANALGIMREEGRGCKRSYRAALSMYQIAAQQNFPPGMLNLGLLLLNSAAQPDINQALGEVETTHVQALAVQWLRKAQAANNPEAADILRKLYAQGPVPGSDNDPWQLPEDVPLLQHLASEDTSNISGLQNGSHVETQGSVEEKDDEPTPDANGSVLSSQTSLQSGTSLRRPNIRVDTQTN